MLLFMCNNAITGWISTINSALPVVLPWVQFLGITMGIVASCYVVYNQRLNARWKRDRDRAAMTAEARELDRKIEEAAKNDDCEGK